MYGMDPRGKVVIVTGASSGIGAAAAEEFARAGANLVIAARNLEPLEAIAERCRKFGVRVRAVAADVRIREQCLALADVARGEFGRIDILVNNAGFAIFDEVAQADSADMERMMQTNYFGTVYCTKGVLPIMLEQRSGAIVNVASIAGIMGFAGMSGYCATKAAVVAFTEALYDEMKERGIAVSLVCPGTTRTNFFVTAEKGKMPAASRLILAIPPQRVARAIVRAARNGSYRTIVPTTAAVFMKFKEIFPRTAHMGMRRVSKLIAREKH